MDLARVNEQPPMHQLAVLSTGWAAFFIRRQMGFITVHFFLLLTIVLLFIYLFWFLAVFPLDMTSHLATLLTFLPL
jgi:hypothetical protein